MMFNTTENIEEKVKEKFGFDISNVDIEEIEDLICQLEDYVEIKVNEEYY